MRLLLAAIIIAAVCADTQMVKQNGEDLELKCEANAQIKWAKDDVKDLVDGVKTGSEGANHHSTLTKSNLTSADAGRYVCYEDDTNTAISNFSVIIVSLSGESIPLVVNVSSTELTCNVNNADIEVSTIVWKRKDQVLNNTEKYMITKANDSHSSTIKINKPEANDEGQYHCLVTMVGIEREFSRVLRLDTKPKVQEFEKLRSKVEDETAVIECNVTGSPTPEITWSKKLEGSEEFVKVVYDARVNATENSDGVPGAKLVITVLSIKTDRGDYMCEASNPLGMDSQQASLKVKDKLAAVWPFLGICAEVAILCSIIFIFEKRRNRRMEEEEEVDAVKHNLMNQSNGNDEVRQRNNAAAKA